MMLESLLADYDCSADEMADRLRCGRARISEFLVSDKWPPRPSIADKIEFLFALKAAKRELSLLKKQARRANRMATKYGDASV